MKSIGKRERKGLPPNGQPFTTSYEPCHVIPITIEHAACPMTFKRIETPCPAFSYRLSDLVLHPLHGSTGTERCKFYQQIAGHRIITYMEAALQLGNVSTRHVQRLVASRQLKAVGRGRARRIVYASIVAYIEREAK